MFRFNFQLEDESATSDQQQHQPTDLNPDQPPTDSDQPLAPLQELKPTDILPIPIEVEKITITPLSKQNKTAITLYKRVLSDIKVQIASEENIDNNNTEEDIIFQWIDGLDVVPKVYEGGFKTWESAVDLSSFLLGQPQDMFFGKNVLELGCGSGLPSQTIINQFQPNSVHFSDYNYEVLRLATAPNLMANLLVKQKPELLVDSGRNGLHVNFNENCSLFENNFRFFAGDWDNMESNSYDVILTTETIYIPELIPKLYKTITRFLAKPNGIAFVAAKTIYFGCGGGTLQFKSLVEQKNELDCKVAWSTSSGVAREIIVLTWKQ